MALAFQYHIFRAAGDLDLRAFTQRALCASSMRASTSRNPQLPHSQAFARPATFNVVAESRDWIVVEKPPFVEVHPSKPNGRKTLWDGLRELLAYEIVNGGQVSIINRLDRETSGLTLVAKHRNAARAFCLEMEARRVTKEYLALVWGWPEEDAFGVEAPILRQGDRRDSIIYLKQMVHSEGARAATDFRVERRFTLETSAGSRFALVRAFPRTGRMHQIRVHLAHAGYPVVGDKIYGPDEGCYLEFIQTGWTRALAGRLLLPRHALHSAVLAIPSQGLAWHSPLPPDLAAWAGLAGSPFAEG
jgi:23S rRNA pseudouridine1911/1915/1917 synthase